MRHRRAYWAGRAIAALCVTVIFGAAFYYVSRGDRELIDCIFSVVTATTVGYGDFSPANPAERAVVSCYCLFSTGVVAW